MLPIANKVTLANPSTRCDMLALHHYRRDNTIRPRGIGTIRKFPRHMAAEKLSGIRFPYRVLASRSMMCSRSAHSTMQEVTTPEIQATNPRIKRSRDNSVTMPIEARSSKSVSQVKPKEE